MKTFDIASCSEVQELSFSECGEIHGGDKFMHDLGYAIGAFLSWIEDNASPATGWGGI
jgi:hypothetical protein